MRVCIDIDGLLEDPILSYYPNFTSNLFVSLGKEIFTQILPYSLHIFNIRRKLVYAIDTKYVSCGGGGEIVAQKKRGK